MCMRSTSPYVCHIIGGHIVMKECLDINTFLAFYLCFYIFRFFYFFFFYFAEAYKFLHSRLMCEAICRYTSYNCVSQSFRPCSAKRCWFWTLWNHLCKQCPLLEATLLCPIHPFRGRLTYRTYDYSKILCLLFFLLVLLDFWIWILIIPGTMWRCWVRKENRRENWPLHWLGGQAPKPEKPGLSHLWTLVF